MVFVASIIESWRCPFKYVHYHPVDIRTLYSPSLVLQYKLIRPVKSGMNNLLSVTADCKVGIVMAMTICRCSLAY
ncbi:hypothetical protein HDG32_001088 [Paraburkholderia sp. CI2]|nr:hypothetical protein [Paraburkholderia sp. CI2]